MTRRDVVITNQVQGSYVTIDIDLQKVSSLHMALLTQASIQGLLKSSWMVENGSGALHFQVTSKLSATEYFNRYTLSPSRLRDIFTGMLELVNQLEQSFLNPSYLVQDYEHIYIDPHVHKVFMMYNPGLIQSESITATDKLYEQMRYILMEKARLENGEGMDALLNLMNRIKYADRECYSEAINTWLMEERSVVEHLNLNATSSMIDEEIVPNQIEFVAQAKEALREAAEQHRAPLVIHENNSTVPTVTRVGIPTVGTIKRLIMVAMIIIMMSLAGISLIKPVGVFEGLIAVAMGICVSGGAEAFNRKKRNHHEDSDNPSEDQLADQFCDQAELPQTLYFEERWALKESQTLTEIEENRTVMLESAVKNPILKAINVGVNDIEIHQERLLIGRCPTSSDITLSSNTVGRIHAEILSSGKILKVKDFNTLNGTYINGIRIHGDYSLLENMDTVKFSCFEFRVIMP